MTELIVVAGVNTYYGSHFAFASCLKGARLLVLCETEAAPSEDEPLATWRKWVAEAYERRGQSAGAPEILAWNCLAPNSSARRELRRLRDDHREGEFWYFAEDSQPQRHLPLMLSLARDLNFSRFVYVSHVYAQARGDGPITEAEASLEAASPRMQGFLDGERTVKSFCSVTAMAFRILRTPIPVGPSLSKKQEGCNGFLGNLFAALYARRHELIAAGSPLVLPGREHGTLNLMPADHFALDVAHLRESGWTAGPYHHLTGNVCVPMDFALAVISRNLGLPGIQLREDARLQPGSMAAAIMAECEGDVYLWGQGFGRELPQRRGVPRIAFYSVIYELRRRMDQETNSDIFGTEILEHNGAALKLSCAGDRAKPPVLLINAIGMPVDLWSRLAKSLIGAFSVYTWESRGVPSTFSTDPDGPLSLDDQLRDCVAVMDHFDLASAHVIGWCSGAHLASRFAAVYPSRVGKLVLINGTYNLKEAGCSSEFMRILSTTLSMVAKNRKYAAMYHRLNYGAKQSSVPDDDPEEFVLDYDPALFHLTSSPFKDPEQLYQYARLVDAVLSENGEGSLSQIRLPVLVVTGSKDLTAGPQASRQAAKILAAQAPVAFHELADGDHYSICYHAQVPQLIETFLNSEHPAQ